MKYKYTELVTIVEDFKDSIQGFLVTACSSESFNKAKSHYDLLQPFPSLLHNILINSIIEEYNDRLKKRYGIYLRYSLDEFFDASLIIVTAYKISENIVDNG